jgi:hypothetical protein
MFSKSGVAKEGSRDTLLATTGREMLSEEIDLARVAFQGSAASLIKPQPRGCVTFFSEARALPLVAA